MNFRPELAAMVMAGEKTQTRRLVSDNPRSPWWKERCGFNVGRSYAVCPGRGKTAVGRLLVVRTVKARLSESLQGRDVEAEGFSRYVEFREAWKVINGAYDPDAWVWVVWFQVVSNRP